MRISSCVQNQRTRELRALSEFRISQCGIPNAALVYGDDSSVHEMHPGNLSTDLDVVDSRTTVRLRPKADAAHSLEELTSALRRGKPRHVLSNE